MFIFVDHHFPGKEKRKIVPMSDTPSLAVTGTTLEKLQHRFNVKKMELDSLLEVTQAINGNLPEESIYKIYHFTLRANLNINKLALFVFDETWACKVNFGTQTDWDQLVLPSNAFTYREITAIDKNDTSVFQEFDLVVPIAQKSQVLAYVFLGNEQQDGETPRIDTVFVQTLTNIVIVAIENKKLARRQLRQEALNREIEIARQVQTLLFPKGLPYSDTVQVKAHYFPHRVIGGDYYDFIQISEAEFLVCIADVSGKGVPAAILMSNFQASLRTLVRQTNHLKTMVEELNHLIYQNARGENFITFFAAIYNQAQQSFCYINAGHNPPLFLVPGQPMRLLDKGTTILGAFQPLPFLEETFLEGIGRFTLFCYTDGLTEVNNRHGEEFGPENLARFFEDNRHLDPDDLHERLIKEINDFKAEKDFDDDVTLLTCRINNQ